MVGSIERKLTLELCSTGVSARLPARQGESLIYKILIGFTWNGRRYFPEDAVWAEVRATLPDGRIISSDCVIEDGQCVFIPGSEFFSCGGAVLCRVVLRGDDGGELCAPVFAIDAEPSSAVSDQAVQAEQYSRMAELLRQVMEEKNSLDSGIAEMLSEFSEDIDRRIAEMSGLGEIGDIKRIPDLADYFPVFSIADDKYMKMPWSVLRLLVKTHVDGAVAANAIVDAAGNFRATLPDMTENGVLALAADLENLPSETWSFELADGTTVEKQVMVR